MSNRHRSGNTALVRKRGARSHTSQPAHVPVAAYRAPDRGERNRVRDVFSEERPWGAFEQFVSNEQVTVKIITVEPGHRLSLQKHDQRGEMWQVLDVPIDVTLDERTWTARPGETIWVPRGSVHRMGNSGDQPGRMLEVAFGHFDEDDIHRLEDDYAR
jgi:mannose-1-phosphate guanylyltransferase/mannose-6-phosphate isomerase